MALRVQVPSDSLGHLVRPNSCRTGELANGRIRLHTGRFAPALFELIYSDSRPARLLNSSRLISLPASSVTVTCSEA